MHVKCTHTSSDAFPRAFVEDVGIGLRLGEYPLVLEKHYTVYAWGMFFEVPWYCICDEENVDAPFWRPCFLFEVSDRRQSRYWKYWFNYEKSLRKKDAPIVELVFEQWGEYDHFYNDLVDGNEENLRIFQRYRVRMDHEFPHPGVLLEADSIKDDWVMCPKCSEAWETGPLEGMVTCPSCNAFMRNPLFIDLCEVRNSAKIRNIRSSGDSIPTK